MSKRTALIIIILTIVLGTTALYFIIGGKGGNILAPIFDGSPFGTAPDGSPTTPGEGGDEEDQTPGETTGGTLPRFTKLSDVPVAGFVGFIKNGVPHTRYVERATGHVYDVNPSTLQKTRIINTTSPQVYEAIFRSDGAGFISRRLSTNGETITNTAISLTAPASTSTDPIFTAQSTVLRSNVGEIVVLPNNNLLYNTTDTSAIATSAFTGANAKNVLSLPFYDWRFNAYSNTNSLIVSKASILAEGYAYRLNITNGGLTRVLGPLLGLTAVPSSNGEKVAFSYTDTLGAQFAVANLNTNSISNILPATLAEKCTWSKREVNILICGVPANGLGTNSPDSWYEGSVSYSDRIWRFNTLTDTAEIILDPEKNFEQKVDVTNPSLSTDEDYLFFINKSDLSLWSLKLDI